MLLIGMTYGWSLLKANGLTEAKRPYLFTVLQYLLLYRGLSMLQC